MKQCVYIYIDDLLTVGKDIKTINFINRKYLLLMVNVLSSSNSVQQVNNSRSSMSLESFGCAYNEEMTL